MGTNAPTAKRTMPVDAAIEHAARLLDSQPRGALDQVREILSAAPGHPQAQLIEAKALRLLGDFPAARAVITPLAAAQPRSAATACELGIIAAALGKLRLAADAFQRAVTLNAEMAPAWSGLAGALREGGHHAEADKAATAAIQASTRDPVMIKAAMALGEGRIDVAEAVLRARLRAVPTDAPAMRMLGEVAWRIGRIDDALKLLDRTLKLAPAFEPAREFYCRLLSQIGRVADAVAQTDILLRQSPGNPAWLMLKASLLVRVGQQADAATIYETLTQRDGTQPRVWMNLGHVRKTLGEQDAAIAAYRAAIALCPTIGEAWWSLANLKTVKLDAADIAAMTRALETVEDDEDAYHLHFSLGKALEDAGDYAASFTQYHKANALRRKSLDYSADDVHARAQGHAALFDAAFFAGLPAGGCAAPDPIFILGMPRAGSTLVEQILSSHSQIEGTAELPDMMMLAARLDSRVEDGEFASLGDLVRTLSPADRTRLGEEYLERTRVHRRTNRPFFIDKMPNNWQHLGLIRTVLPKAKIIDARRHPLGCCFSGWKQHFARGQAFSYDLDEIGRYYRDYVTQMAAFDTAAPGTVHRVIYERMVEDTPGEVARLLGYLGLPFEEACLSFWENKRAVRTASSEQVRRPIFTDAVDHWRHYEPWLAPLVDALGPVVAAYPEAPTA